MTIERDADDVASCFALEALLREAGFDQVFAGEITGLIAAGAFIAFGPRRSDADSEPSMPPFEGMLPVRLLRAPAPTPARAAQGDGARDWWELNEQGTILRGERSGATLRLGDPIEVRVARVDAVRGRVDLTPAG
jgi:ribonuclease R